MRLLSAYFFLPLKCSILAIYVIALLLSEKIASIFFHILIIWYIFAATLSV